MRKIDNYKTLISGTGLSIVSVYLITISISDFITAIKMSGIVLGVWFIIYTIIILANQNEIREKEETKRLVKENEAQEDRRNERMQTRLKVLQTAKDILGTQYIENIDRLETSVNYAEDRFSQQSSNITDDDAYKEKDN